MFIKIWIRTILKFTVINMTYFLEIYYQYNNGGYRSQIRLHHWGKFSALQGLLFRNSIQYWAPFSTSSH